MLVHLLCLPNTGVFRLERYKNVVLINYCANVFLMSHSVHSKKRFPLRKNIMVKSI